jgi:hypothetical protein
MRIPQTAERIKEAPAQALRAVFAGVGQVLLIGERVRRRAGGEAAPEAAPTGQAEGTSTASASGVSAPDSSAPKTSATKASATKASATKASATKAPAATTAKTGTPAAGSGPSEPPVPHYRELSIASLRARLRGLDVAQVRELINYERAHEDRANVIAMFERRIAKLEEAGDADATKD